MDPKSSYLLEIRLSYNPKKRRKDISYFSFSKVVDSSLCNFKDPVEEIVNQYLLEICPRGNNRDDHILLYP
jgi:hypothetical protein